VASLIEASIPPDRAADSGARKIGPNVQYFRREVARRIVLFALAIGKLGEQLVFFERPVDERDLRIMQLGCRRRRTRRTDGI
jgi:hypothetical protein